MLFSVNLRYKSKNLNKIWKTKNPRWRPPVTSFIWLLLPWKLIRHHVVSLNWKNKWSLLYLPNFKSIGWIVSKVKGGGGIRLTPPRPRVTIFSSRLLGLKHSSKWETVWFTVKIERFLPKSCSTKPCYPLSAFLPRKRITHFDLWNISLHFESYFLSDIKVAGDYLSGWK